MTKVATFLKDNRNPLIIAGIGIVTIGILAAGALLGAKGEPALTRD